MANRTRYTEKKKQEVVNFVKKFDAENGRGGQAAAKKKWGINPITIKSWCVQQGYAAPARGKAKPKAKPAAAAAAKPAAAKKQVRKATRKPGRKAGRKPAVAAAARSAAAPVKSGSTASTLAKMSSIQDKIDSLQSEFNALKGQL